MSERSVYDRTKAVLDYFKPAVRCRPLSTPASHVFPQPVRRTATVERKDACPCGSVKKYKKCGGKGWPMAMNLDSKVGQAAQAINAADALLISAGAGMGVDSGLLDFRGVQGFWRAYPAIAKLGLSFEELAKRTWFSENPHLAWAFYGHRLNLYRKTTPHQGFSQLLELGRSKVHGYFGLTSNVDGQFQRVGFAADRVVECHGSINHFQCAASCTDEIWDADSEAVNLDGITFRAQEPLPKCRHCSALARPNILMFNDWSWLGHRTDAQQVCFAAWLNGLAKSSAHLAVIELGAGSAIATVRQTSERVVERIGGKLIRINPREHDVPDGQIGLPFWAAEGVRRICHCTENSARESKPCD